jgi:hypothetical protein
VELRKVNDDPLDLDELILHVQKINGADEAGLSRDLYERCLTHLEIHPNRICFHTADEIRQLQGVGRLLKEEKVADHRPGLKLSGAGAAIKEAPGAAGPQLQTPKSDFQ